MNLLRLNKPVGILGGTFDPIHMGHLRLAIELRDAFDLAEVRIIPCYQPVHRELPIATPQQRLAMVECAVAEEKTLIADDREILRKGPSYTIDTLLEMRQALPGTPLCLLLGIDAFLGFSSWHRYQDILQEAHIIVAHRPNYRLPREGVVTDLVRDLQQDKRYLHRHLAGGIVLCPITLLEISATNIRESIAKGEDPRYLLPNAVCDYILKHDLYKSE